MQVLAPVPQFNGAHVANFLTLNNKAQEGTHLVTNFPTSSTRI